MLLKLKIQLYCGDEIAMGPGKADLLDAIGAHGSISAAARAIGMSYRRAWLLVDCMNRCWREPLVETSPGTSRGGGAVVTSYGETVLTHYRQLERKITGAAACPDYAALADAMLVAPKASQKTQIISAVDDDGRAEREDPHGSSPPPLSRRRSKGEASP